MQKTTQNLLNLMKTSKSLEKFQEENKDEFVSYMEIGRALTVKLREKGLKKANVIHDSGLETHYCYQIFDGRKTPTRDKVLAICLAMKLELEEVQQLLRICGYPQLYSRERRDSIIQYGILNKKDIIDLNTLLLDNQFEILTPEKPEKGEKP